MKRTLCLICLWLPLAGFSQPMALVWHQIANGGFSDPSTGGQLQGTVGQAEATGGGSALIAGFWNSFSAGVPATTVFSLTSSENPALFQSPVQFVANVTLAGIVQTNATGTVQFLTNGVVTGVPVGMSAGQATLVLATLPAGTIPITAVYSGDASYDGAEQTIDQVMARLPPVAQPYAITRTAGLALHIFWANVATNWSDQYGDAVALAGVNLVTTNGVTVLANSTQVLYPASAPNAGDQISYSITDGQGGTNTGFINIMVNPFVTGKQSPTINVGNGTITATFYGIPGYIYEVQRSTNLQVGLGWLYIATNTVSANGLIRVVDDFTNLGGHEPATAYYRLVWQP